MSRYDRAWVRCKFQGGQGSFNRNVDIVGFDPAFSGCRQSIGNRLGWGQSFGSGRLDFSYVRIDPDAVSVLNLPFDLDGLAWSYLWRLGCNGNGWGRQR